MKITLVASQDNPEILWNCLRLGNVMLEGMDDVTIFLNGPSVAYAQIQTDAFPLTELAKLFTLSEGELLA